MTAPKRLSAATERRRMIQEERAENREARAQRRPPPHKPMTVRCQLCWLVFVGDLNYSTTCPHCGGVRVVK